MPTLNFAVRDKIITRNPENEHYVNGNSDYLIHLDLDQEWSEFAALTARLRWIEGSECLNRDILFTGTDFEFPVMYNVKYIEIGIFAGNKHTTTPAIIVCDGCILDGDPIEHDPDPDIYAQLLDAIQRGLVAGRSPYIGENGNWYQWSESNHQYVDTGIASVRKPNWYMYPGGTRKLVGTRFSVMVEDLIPPLVPDVGDYIVSPEVCSVARVHERGIGRILPGSSTITYTSVNATVSAAYEGTPGMYICEDPCPVSPQEDGLIITAKINITSLIPYLANGPYIGERIYFTQDGVVARIDSVQRVRNEAYIAYDYTLKGDTGATGEKGEKGDNGDRGEKGDTGRPGLFTTNVAIPITGNLTNVPLSEITPNITPIYGEYILSTNTKCIARIVDVKSSYIVATFSFSIIGPQGPQGKSPYIGDNGNWFEWSVDRNDYVDTGVQAMGEQGEQGEVGPQGPAGESGVYYGSTPPTDPDIKVWIDEGGSSLIIPTALSDLSDDSNHRTVTDAEKSAWSGKQNALVSGQNIKTINGQSILGSGNLSSASGTFWAVYNVTTLSQIEAANDEGKIVCLKYNDDIFTLVHIEVMSSVGAAVFVCPRGDGMDKIVLSFDAGDEEWRTPTSFVAQSQINDLSEIRAGAALGATAAQPDDIPTALSDLTDDSTHRTVTDAEKESWSESDIFSCTYGTTTLAQIKTAVADDKLPVCKYQDVYYVYSGISGEGLSEKALFTSVLIDVACRLSVSRWWSRTAYTIAKTTDIPTVNDATLTIQKNGTTVATFTANSASNQTANITVPTALSELSGDATHRLVTDTEKATWNGKQDAGELTIGETTYELRVSTTDAGQAGYITFVTEE